jgi:hypothetical protein
VALVVAMALACKPEVLTTTAPDSGATTSASEPKAPAATGLPTITLRAEGPVDTSSPSVATVSAWLEDGCRAQPEFTGSERVGKIEGSYRAAQQSKGDASGRTVGSVFFELRLRLGSDEPYRTEAFVGQELAGVDTNKELAELVKTVAGEVTSNLAKQVRVRRASDDALIAHLKDTDDDLVSFAVAEVRARKLKVAATQVAGLLEHPNRDIVNVAAGSLAEIGSKSDVPALIKAGSRVAPVDRLPVIFALGELGGPDVVAYLETLAAETDSAAVKGAAERALVRARARP